MDNIQILTLSESPISGNKIMNIKLTIQGEEYSGIIIKQDKIINEVLL